MDADFKKQHSCFSVPILMTIIRTKQRLNMATLPLTLDP